jgi:hypothetical protein
MAGTRVAHVESGVRQERAWLFDAAVHRRMVTQPGQTEPKQTLCIRKVKRLHAVRKPVKPVDV